MSTCPRANALGGEPYCCDGECPLAWPDTEGELRKRYGGKLWSDEELADAEKRRAHDEPTP